MKTPSPSVETIAKTTEEELAALRKKVEELSANLATETAARSVAEQAADAANKLAASNQGLVLLQREITEIPTGKKVKVKRCKEYEVVSYKDDGRPVHKPVFHEVELPTYYYRIDLPASGGQGVKLGERWYYQDETYELDIDTLRTVKDIVHRSWQHEASTQGNNENVFRRPKNQTLSARGVRG